MKTRDRILLTARSMFNEHGYGNVTVAMLSQELNMTKGNLWYHFNNKRSLLEALSKEFIELDGKRRMIEPDDTAILESYVRFLNALAQEFREFRFLFRDHSDYGDHTAIMLDHLPTILNESLEQFIRFFRAMKKNGYLTIQNSDIESLALNVVLVLRYNLEFMRERQLLSKEGSGAVMLTLKQHLTLFSDKLSPNAIDFFRIAFADKSAEQVA